MRDLINIIIVILAVVCTPRKSVLAQSADRSAEAEVLFRQAKQLMAAGQIAEACAAFDSSQNAEPALTTLINLADCREKKGDLATAWGLFTQAKRQARVAVDKINRKLEDVAAKHADALENRLSTLTLIIDSANIPDGLIVSRNERQVDAGSWNRALPIDGGTHRIVARAPGYQEWSDTIQIEQEQAKTRLKIPRLRPIANTPAGIMPALRSDTRPQGPLRDERSQASTRMRTAALISGGVGVASLAAGVYFALRARTISNDVAMMYDAELDNSGKAANRNMFVSYGVGSLSVTAGAIMYYLYTRKHSGVTPALSLGRRGLSVGWVY